MRKTLIIIQLLVAIGVYAQTPPARTYYYDKYDRKQGVKERWEEDGSGLKHGKYIKYTYSGDRQVLGYYNHGKTNGKWEIDVTEDLGILGKNRGKSISHFRNGVQHGRHSMYLNGDLVEQGNYVEGKRDGVWKEDYDSDEGVYTEGSYSSGLRVGVWKNAIFKGIYNDAYIGMMALKGKDVGSYNLKTQKGYTTYFNEKGEFTKCLTPKGEDLIELNNYEKLITLKNELIKLNDERSRKSYEKNYHDKCMSFIEEYPNSKYLSEIETQKDSLEIIFSKDKNRAELIERVKIGDFESIKEYYGQNSSFANLYRVVNGIEVNSSFHIKSKDVNHATQSKEHEEKAECFKSILAKSKNSIASEAVQTWYGTDPSLLMGQIHCKYSSDRVLEINWGKKYYGDYHTNLYFYPNELAWKNYGSSYFIYSKGEQIDKVKGKWYDGYWNKNEEQRYALDYINLMRTSSIDYDGFANKLFSILKFSTDTYKKECLKLYLSKIENRYKIQPTKVHDELAMKDIYRSILLWELGETEKSIDLIRTTNSVYKEYKKPQYQTQSGTWVEISAGKYVKSYIKKEINEKYSVDLTNQKELFKLLKKL